MAQVPTDVADTATCVGLSRHTDYKGFDLAVSSYFDLFPVLSFGRVVCCGGEYSLLMLHWGRVGMRRSHELVAAGKTAHHHGSTRLLHKISELRSAVGRATFSG